MTLKIDLPEQQITNTPELTETQMDLVKEVQRLKDLESIRTVIAKYGIAAVRFAAGDDATRPLFARSATGAGIARRWAFITGAARRSPRAWRSCANARCCGRCTTTSRRCRTVGRRKSGFCILVSVGTGAYEFERKFRRQNTDRRHLPGELTLEDGAGASRRMELNLRLVAPAGERLAR